MDNEVLAASSEVTETAEVLEVDVDRPFLSTSLDEYTVTEGLLLLIVLILFFSKLSKALKEGFYWLMS